MRTFPVNNGSMATDPDRVSATPGGFATLNMPPAAPEAIPGFSGPAWAPAYGARGDLPPGQARKRGRVGPYAPAPGGPNRIPSPVAVPASVAPSGRGLTRPTLVLQ